MHFLLAGVAVILVPVFVFCLIGFLATFEPPGYPGQRTLYAVGMALSVAFIARVMVTGLRKKPGPSDDPAEF